MQKSMKIMVLIIFLIPIIADRLAAEKILQVVAGAGPSTQTVTKFVELLKKTSEGGKYNFKVPQKSAKHKGGLNNAKRFIFGRTGRPLNAEEKKLGFEELFLAKVPVTIVAGTNTGVSRLSVDQVCDIFQGKVTNWKTVGGNDLPIVIFTREPGEALFLQLKKEVVCFRKVAKTKYVFKKDHQTLSAFKKLKLGKHAIGFGALSYFPKEYLVQVDGFDVGVANGLVFLKKNQTHPLIKAAKNLSQTKEWHEIVINMDLLIP